MSYAQDSSKENSDSNNPLSKITSRFIPIDLVSKETDQKVDSIITNGIKNHAFPGAQVLVAKKGDIIFHKAYGFYTYDSIQPVALNAIYDLASVTKITGPLLALMKLYDEGKLDLDVPFCYVLETLETCKEQK